MKNKKTLYILVICFYIILFKNAFTSTYYIALNGNDLNNGSERTPWKTIQKAANEMQAGDTVYVKQGIYYELINIHKSGHSNSARIVYMAYPGDKPIIDGTGILIPDWKALIYSGNYFNGGTKYITLDGFEIRNSSWYGIRSILSSSWIIKNCKVHHIEKCGIVFHQSDSLLIKNNEVFSVGLNNGNGINLQGGNNSIIEYNYCHDNKTHFGIQIFPDNLEADTLFYYHNIVRNNICARNKSGMYFRNNINLSIYNNIIYHNLVDGEYAGIHFGKCDGTCESFNSNTKIFNNTIIGHQVSIYNQAFNYLEIKNNIFYSPQKAVFEFSSDAQNGHIIDYNIYYGKDYFKKGVNDFYADPWFINVDNDNYLLSSNSPAIDRGVALLMVTHDIQKTPRPQGTAYDIGAHEVVNSKIDTFPPDPPIEIQIRIIDNLNDN